MPSTELQFPNHSSLGFPRVFTVTGVGAPFTGSHPWPHGAQVLVTAEDLEGGPESSSVSGRREVGLARVLVSAHPVSVYGVGLSLRDLGRVLSLLEHSSVLVCHVLPLWSRPVRCSRRLTRSSIVNTGLLALSSRVCFSASVGSMGFHLSVVALSWTVSVFADLLWAVPIVDVFAVAEGAFVKVFDGF